MTTIAGNRGQLWASTLSPHLLSPIETSLIILEVAVNIIGEQRISLKLF